MKKIYYFALFFCCSFMSWSNAQAQAYTLTDTDVTVTDGEITAYAYAGGGTAPTDIIIPNTLDGQTVTAIGASAFFNNSLTSVNLPASLTSIGGSAFFNNSLTSIDLSSATSLISIGNSAFSFNSLTSVDLSGATSLTTIGVSVFQSNSLTSVTLPASLTTISNFAFVVNSLTSVTFPASLTSIGTGAFQTNSLTSVDLSGATSLTSIGGDAFQTNSLTSVDLSGATSLTTIGANAFTANTGLTSITLPATASTGFTTTDWESNGGTMHALGSDITNFTLSYTYAGTPIDYTITYTLNGGIAPTPNNPATYTIRTSTITLAPPTRDGYTFEGWYNEATFATEVTEISVGNTGNLTLHARWLTNYNITYELGEGGMNASANPSTYTEEEEEAITLVAPTRPGYTFAGWYNEATFTTEVTEISVGSTGAKTFYAKWELAPPYMITYEAGEGSTAPTTNPTTYTVEDNAVALVAPTPRTGYIFIGWYTEATSGTEVTEIPMDNIAGDLTLHARWGYILTDADVTVNDEGVITAYTGTATDIAIPGTLDGTDRYLVVMLF